MATDNGKAEPTVQEVHRLLGNNQQAEAVEAAHKLYKDGDPAANNQTTEKLQNELHGLASLAAANYRAGSPALKMADLNNSGGVDDEEWKVILRDKKGDAFDQMMASYSLLNSSRLSGGNSEVTPLSLARAAKPDNLPSVDLVFGHDQDKHEGAASEVAKPNAKPAAKVADAGDKARTESIEAAARNLVDKSLPSLDTIAQAAKAAGLAEAGLKITPADLRAALEKHIRRDLEKGNLKPEDAAKFPRVGGAFVASGAVTEAQLDRALEHQKSLQDQLDKNPAKDGVKARAPKIGALLQEMLPDKAKEIGAASKFYDELKQLSNAEKPIAEKPIADKPAADKPIAEKPGDASLVKIPAPIDLFKDKDRDIANGAKIALADSGEMRVTRPDGSSVSKLTIDGKVVIEEKTGDKSLIWTKTKGQTWESKQAPGQERQNMTLMGNGNLVYETTGEKHIVRSNGNEFVEGKGRSAYDFDQDGRVKSVHFPDNRTTFNFDYKGKGAEIAKVSCVDGKTGKVIEAKPDKTWGNPKIEADGSYSQYGYQVQGDQVFMGKQTFHPDGRFQKDTLQPDGKVTTTDGTGKILGSRLANKNDFVQPVAATPDAPVSPEKLLPVERRQDKPADQPEKKAARPTPGELFEPTSGS